MFKDFIPVFSGLLSLFVVVLLYDLIQSLLKRKSSTLNKQMAFALNILVAFVIFAMIGIALYFTLAAILSAAVGEHKLLG